MYPSLAWGYLQYSDFTVYIKQLTKKTWLWLYTDTAGFTACTCKLFINHVRRQCIQLYSLCNSFPAKLCSSSVFQVASGSLTVRLGLFPWAQAERINIQSGFSIHLMHHAAKHFKLGITIYRLNISWSSLQLMVGHRTNVQ